MSREAAHLRQRVCLVSPEWDVSRTFRIDVLIRYNKLLYHQFDEARCTRLLQALELPHRAHARTLSLGMKTQLRLALALSAHPRVLLLDEPTNGLDPVVKRQFLQLLVQESAVDGMTILLATHHLEDLDGIADGVAVMHGGRVIAYKLTRAAPFREWRVSRAWLIGMGLLSMIGPVSNVIQAFYHSGQGSPSERVFWYVLVPVTALLVTTVVTFWFPGALIAYVSLTVPFAVASFLDRANGYAATGPSFGNTTSGSTLSPAPPDPLGWLKALSPIQLTGTSMSTGGSPMQIGFDSGAHYLSMVGWVWAFLELWIVAAILLAIRCIHPSSLVISHCVACRRKSISSEVSWSLSAPVSR